MTKQKARNIWYLADGIYSMQGDFLPTNDLIDLLDKYQNFFVYVDDAHGFSWTGKHGAGHVLGNQFIHPKMITAVSMCKSFGAFGGIISFYDKKMADMLRYTGQSLIFSAPISPPILGAAIASARIHLADDIVHLQHDLLNRIYFFQQKCAEYEVPLVTDNAGPIQFIEIGNNDLVYSVALDLNKKGVYATPAVFPSMPKNHGGLRFSITRHISLDDIDMAVGYLSDILKTFTSNHFANNKTA
jgi:7-keto-8-aminopelargonate synthetase-like enzyme